MKKIYLSAIVLLAGVSSLNAQIMTQPISAQNLATKFKASTQKPTASPKAIGVTIYTNDFDTPSDFVIDNDGQTGADFGWNINATSESWHNSFASGINSTSGGKYAELVNGDPTATPATQAMDVTYTMTLASPMDLTNLPLNTTHSDQVLLQFEQYGALFNDQQTVEISTDGGATWTEVRDNRDYHDALSQSGGSAYPNPELVTINLAPYVTGAATNFSFRFVWTSAFDQPTNPNVWVTYGWFIDDIKIITKPDNDLQTETAYWGSNGVTYYQVPVNQIAPIDFSVEANNMGANDQTNCILNVAISGAVTTNASSPAGVTVPVNEMDTLEIVAGFTPSSLGTYNIAMDITQDQTDDVPSNNVIDGDSFEVGNYIYARDNGTPEGYFSNGGYSYRLCNEYDMFADQTVYSIQTMLNANSNIGAQFQAVIYRLSPTASTLDQMVQVGFTDFIDVTSTNTGVLLDLPLLSPTLLQADSMYFASIISAGDNGVSNDVLVTTAGLAPDQTIFLYDGNESKWYFTNNAPIIRLNFENTLGVNELDNTIALNVYPNPAKDQVNVSFALNNGSDVQVEVIDITGKVVAAVNNSNLTAGSQNISVNTSDFAAGSYTVIVKHNEGMSSSKFIKR